MNTTLPPSRDLPPRRHAEIRYTVLTTAAGKPPRRVLAPLVTAAAALAIVGLVAYFVPWGKEDSAAQPPAGTTTAETTTAEAPVTTVAGVAPDEAAAIEQGCAASAGLDGKFTLTQLITDEAGQYALLYSDTNVLGCTLDDGSMDYNAGFSSLSAFTGPVSFDYNAGAMGGDVPGGKADYAGQRGYEVVAGRVTPEVAKVTYVQDGDSADAVIANGTYLARIVHPTTWGIPENRARPVIRAYDKKGTLLAEVSP